MDVQNSYSSETEKDNASKRFLNPTTTKLL
jgi:hypothetical protein